MDTFLKVVAVIIFAPFVISLAAQVVVVAFIAIIPYVLVFAAMIGIAAGLTAGFVLRRRLPSPGRGGETDDFPIPPPEPIRRPRGPRRQEH